MRTPRGRSCWRPAVFADRVIYLGESLGGAVAPALALEHPPAGLVLMSTFTSIRDMARRHYPIVPPAVLPDAYPSLRRVRELRAPLLVIHGDCDEIVPLLHAEALFEAAPDPKRLHTIEGIGHRRRTVGRGHRPLQRGARVSLRGADAARSDRHLVEPGAVTALGIVRGAKPPMAHPRHRHVRNILPAEPRLRHPRPNVLPSPRHQARRQLMPPRLHRSRHRPRPPGRP
jgi:fermentation-respiration switch protein FrsA (DUF1100 family)